MSVAHVRTADDLTAVVNSKSIGKIGPSRTSRAKRAADIDESMLRAIAVRIKPSNHASIIDARRPDAPHAQGIIDRFICAADIKKTLRIRIGAPSNEPTISPALLTPAAATSIAPDDRSKSCSGRRFRQSRG